LETPENPVPAQPDDAPSSTAAAPTPIVERRLRPRNGNGAPVAAADAPPPRTQPEPQPSRKFYAITELLEMNPKQMLEAAKEFGVTDLTGATTKDDIIMRILQAQTEAQGNIFAQGILEIVEDGFGFLPAARTSSPRRRTYTCPRARCGASACAPATSSPARPARRRTRRSTSRSCVSKQ